jgi:hypothetical protein
VAKTKPEATTKPRDGSEPTGHYLPCPRAVELHSHLLTACHVLRGPKVFHFECSVCGTREIVAPKILKAQDRTKVYGMTLEQVQAQGLVPLP